MAARDGFCCWPVRFLPFSLFTSVSSLHHEWEVCSSSFKERKVVWPPRQSDSFKAPLRDCLFLLGGRRSGGIGCLCTFLTTVQCQRLVLRGAPGKSDKQTCANPGVNIPGPVPGLQLELAAWRRHALSSLERGCWLHSWMPSMIIEISREGTLHVSKERIPNSKHNAVQHILRVETVSCKALSRLPPFAFTIPPIIAGTWSSSSKDSPESKLDPRNETKLSLCCIVFPWAKCSRGALAVSLHYNGFGDRKPSRRIFLRVRLGQVLLVWSKYEGGFWKLRCVDSWLVKTSNIGMTSGRKHFGGQWIPSRDRNAS